VSEVVNFLVHPPRVANPKRLRAAVGGKTVLITGASFGIGEAAARTLATAGATVLLVARSADRLNELAASIDRAVAYPADLTDEAAVAELTTQIVEAHGAPDVVISNAGKSIRRSLYEQYDRPHDFQRTIDINYLGPIRLLLGLLPAMRDRRSGHVVNVSSIGIRMNPGPRWGTYIASKGAFDTWLRSVAAELRNDGVDVTSIYLGLVRTRMSEPTPSLRKVPALSAEQAADVVAKAVIKRPRTVQPRWTIPAELASVLLAGPSDRAARLWYRLTSD
jgi:NAD(P)-dependent dehydrogenase (short-subunit alcohol dehydrogenase family)